LDKKKIPSQNLDVNENINNITKILINDKEKTENEISNLIDSFSCNNENKKTKIFFKIFNFCDDCIKKKFIEGGLENLLNKKNDQKFEEFFYNFDEFLSHNKKIQSNLYEILDNFNNLIKDSSNINDNLISQIINKLKENNNKLNENNMSMEKFMKKMIKKENELKIKEKDEKKNDNYKVSEKYRITYISNHKPILNHLQKTYRIFTKKKIHESKYENKKLNQTEIFQCNFSNQFNNYINNFPKLFKNNSFNIKLAEEIFKKNFLINSLSDIKNLENNIKNKKPIINSMFLPLKYQSLEIEKQISKVKENDINNKNTLDKNNLNSLLSKNNNLNNILLKKNNLNKNNYKIKKSINFGLNNNLENEIMNYKKLSSKTSSYELNQMNQAISPFDELTYGNYDTNQNIINEYLNSININNNHTGIINNIQGQNISQMGYSIINNNNVNNSFLNNPYKYINNNININESNNMNYLNNMQSFYKPNYFNENSLFANKFKNNSHLTFLDNINIAEANLGKNNFDNLEMNNMNNTHQIMPNTNSIILNFNKNNITDNNVPFYNNMTEGIKKDINEE
jgi:hypothetical protein